MDGPYVVVEQRVRNAERVSCPACIGIASRQRNRLDGFCELWGSKSQCDRAEPIRRRTLSQVDVLARHARIEEGDAKTETMSDETAERMARTRFIVDEYTMGVLDEQEAGERLFRHLFPHWG